MSRRARVSIPGYAKHIIQRGNNHKHAQSVRKSRFARK